MARRSGGRRRFSRGRANVGQAVKKLREEGEECLAAAKEALAQGVGLIVADAKARVPVALQSRLSEGLTAGALRESIRAEPNKDKSVYVLTAEAQAKNGEYYGQYVEFDPRINRPFLYPAMDGNREEVTNMIKNAIYKAAKRRKLSNQK